jgi:hypothetical protein
MRGLSLALIGNASGRTLRLGEMLIRGVFDKETRRKPLAFAGRGALWDLNVSLIWAGEIDNGRERRKCCSGCWRELEAGELASRKEGCLDEAKTRRHRRVGARRRVAAAERIRKSRSTCMLIIPRQ